MKALLASKVIPIGMCSIGWYHLHRLDPQKYQELAYNKGRDLTLKYHNYIGWESIVEPMVIRQINLLFSVGNAFVAGLKSDNVKNTKD
jgi:hypothetical protein